MFTKLYIACLYFLLLTSWSVKAQTVSEKGKNTAQTDTIQYKQRINDKTVMSENVIDSSHLKISKPDPSKIMWLGMIIPGYGQILNKKYWKLPLVYGGFLGFAYAISWNGGMYETYRTAYRDILSNDPSRTSYIDILPKGLTINSRGIGGKEQYTRTLKTKQDAFRRNRDLSIFAAIGFYAITIVDAYVDAQLFDFDISPDLTMHIQPTLINNKQALSQTIGVQCSFNLK